VDAGGVKLAGFGWLVCDYPEYWLAGATSVSLPRDEIAEA